MDEPTECDLIADLLAETATGAASGPDRERVMRHLVICDTCWDKLTDLTRVADEVLLAAPEQQPRAGFESAVLDRIAMFPLAEPAQPSRSRRIRRAVAYVLAAAIAAIGGAGVVWLVTSDDRDLAASYRETLEVADGRYFTAEELVDNGGKTVGTVFMYEGDPSWMYVIVRDAPPGTYELEVLANGKPVHEGEVYVKDDGTGGGGGWLDGHVFTVDTIMLHYGDKVLTATHQ